MTDRKLTQFFFLQDTEISLKELKYYFTSEIMLAITLLYDRYHCNNICFANSQFEQGWKLLLIQWDYGSKSLKFICKKTSYTCWKMAQSPRFLSSQDKLFSQMHLHEWINDVPQIQSLTTHVSNVQHLSKRVRGKTIQESKWNLGSLKLSITPQSLVGRNVTRFLRYNGVISDKQSFQGMGEKWTLLFKMQYCVDKMQVLQSHMN